MNNAEYNCTCLQMDVYVAYSCSKSFVIMGFVEEEYDLSIYHYSTI